MESRQARDERGLPRRLPRLSIEFRRSRPHIKISRLSRWRRRHAAVLSLDREKDARKPKGEREVRKMPNPNYARVRAQVSEIREQFGLIEPPVNPVDVARGLGINVHFVEFEPDFANVSGFYDPDENAIVVNKQEFPLRQTFTIAHELGHALLHREWAASEGYRVLMRDDQTDHGEPHEREANAFAAHLLVPRDVLDKYSGLSPQDLSRLFAVSVPMIKNRLMFEYG
jgi:hypothetical protein